MRQLHFSLASAVSPSSCVGARLTCTNASAVWNLVERCLACLSTPVVAVAGAQSPSNKMAAGNGDAEDAPGMNLFALHVSASGQTGPSRSFPCRFCGREFRNAQALGGHMNVHRHERNLARDLLQLRNHSEGPPRTQDVIMQTSNMQGEFCVGSSSSSSSPPSQESISFASALVVSVSKLQRRDSVGRAVDLELRLGNAPDM